MIPIVALIGRRNVGKSTIFNRLTGTRDALVADISGLTRDRQYGYAQFQENNFIIIDTGGIDSFLSTEKVENLVLRQSLVAIEEADIIFLVVDSRFGLISSDQDIVQYLRRYQKPIVIIANKIDGMDDDVVSTSSIWEDCYALGIENIIPISAICSSNMDSLLLQKVLHLITSEKDQIEKQDPLGLDIKNKDVVDRLNPKKNLIDDHIKSLPIKIAVVGLPNVGKSSLVNSILGRDRMIVCDMPGTTRDSIYISILRENQQYMLIDTAGIRNSNSVMKKEEKFSMAKTLQVILDTHVVLLVIDAQKGIVTQDLSLLRIILNMGRSLVIVANKWDGLSMNIQEEIKETFNHRLRFLNFFRIHFISALYGMGVSNLFASIKEAYQCSVTRINTAILNRIMYRAIHAHHPPVRCGRKVKLKYAHMGGYNPLIVVIHGTHVLGLPSSYKRYLTNYFHRSLSIMGTSIRIRFNERSRDLFPNNRKK